MRPTKLGKTQLAARLAHCFFDGSGNFSGHLDLKPDFDNRSTMVIGCEIGGRTNMVGKHMYSIFARPGEVSYHFQFVRNSLNWIFCGVAVSHFVQPVITLQTFPAQGRALFIYISHVNLSPTGEILKPFSKPHAILDLSFWCQTWFYGYFPHFKKFYKRWPIQSLHHPNFLHSPLVRHTTS